MNDRTIAAASSPSGDWEAVMSEPAAALRGLLAGRYVGWSETAGEGLRRREAPIAAVPVILNFANRYVICGPDGAAESFGSFAAGPHDSWSMVEARGDCSCLQFNLTYDGALRLLRRPMRELLNRTISIEDLLGRDGRRLVEALGGVNDWRARFDIVDAFLIQRLCDAQGLAPHVAWATNELSATAGGVDIGGLCAAIGVSRKRLIADFHRDIGLGPKALARLHRFNRAMGRLRSVRAPDLAMLALDCGYYDQSHFNRDFLGFAGVSPIAFLAELQPSDPPLSLQA